MRVDWNDLRYFLALAEAGGLAAAAKELSVSHVTVMRRVRALEEALGGDLFVRRPDGHRLTETGLELLRSAKEGGDLISAALERAAVPQASGRVRITTTEIVANWVLLPHLASLPVHPRLEIDASPGERSLFDAEATIAVRFRRPATGRFRMRKLGAIDMTLYRAACGQRTASGYIGWTGEFESIGLARWLRAAFQDAPPVLALTTIEGHRRAAAAGLGVAALPRFVADTDQALQPVPGPTFQLTAWLALPEAIAARADVREAVKIIRNAFAAAGLAAS